MNATSLAAIVEAPLIRSWRHFAELPSTNDFALQHGGSLDPSELPCLILADRQTAGRGRGSNRWWSAEGALAFSLVIDPRHWDIPVASWPRLSVAIGGAVAEALQEYLPGVEVQLKWPNDVYINDRKVCGILLETIPGASRLVIGLGVNVENSFNGAPREIAGRSISLAEIAPGKISRLDVLGSVLRQIDRDLRGLIMERDALLARWRRRCYLTGKMIAVTDAAETCSGACLGLDDDASLLIQTEAGPRRCYAGVVTVFSPPGIVDGE